MRRSIIASCALLALAIALCAWADAYIDRAVSRADELRLGAVVSWEAGDKTAAEEAIERLAAEWKRRGPVLEMLASHVDIHRVQEEIVRARVLLLCKDGIEFQECVAALGECLEHIRSLEAVSLANIF